MRLGIISIVLGSVLLSGCIREVTDLQEEMRNQPRLYPNDSSSRVLNEMKRPQSSAVSGAPDDRDARISALQQEVAKLREQYTRTAAPLPNEAEKTIIVVLREQEFFVSGSADLTPDAIRALKQAGEVLKPYAAMIKKIRVEGHTDDRPIHTKRFSSNQALSEARAQIVAWYLQRESGFPAERFAITGHGAAKPVASNRTPEGRARNRRVEVAITSNSASER